MFVFDVVVFLIFVSFFFIQSTSETSNAHRTPFVTDSLARFVFALNLYMIPFANQNIMRNKLDCCGTNREKPNREVARLGRGIEAKTKTENNNKNNTKMYIIFNYVINSNVNFEIMWS